MNGQCILGATDAQLPQHFVCTKQGQNYKRLHVPIQACGTHGLYLYPCTDTMHYLYSTVTFIFFQSCTSVLLHITYHSAADEQSIATCYLVCNNAL